MSDKTGIEWCDATWNPIAGCQIKSPGCINCYAMRDAFDLVRRFDQPKYRGLTKLVNEMPVWTGEVRLWPDALPQPARWTRGRRIFVNSMSDLFYEKLDFDIIDQVVDAMDAAPQHQYQILTKRPDVMQRYLSQMKDPRPRKNWWMGVSVEDQPRADERLLNMVIVDAHGWNTWVSYEPAIGAVDWAGWEFIKWMVSGGESGDPRDRQHDPRPSLLGWHNETDAWCARNRIPYLFKQWGNWLPINMVPPEKRASKMMVVDGETMVWWPKKGVRLLNGRLHDGYPATM